MRFVKGFAAWFGLEKALAAVVKKVDVEAELARVNALYAVDRAAWRAERVALWRLAGV